MYPLNILVFITTGCPVKVATNLKRRRRANILRLDPDVTAIDMIGTKLYSKIKAVAL